MDHNGLRDFVAWTNQKLSFDVAQIRSPEEQKVLTDLPVCYVYCTYGQNILTVLYVHICRFVLRTSTEIFEAEAGCQGEREEFGC